MEQNDPTNFKVIKLTPIDGQFCIDLTKLPSIDGMTIIAPDVENATVDLTSTTVLISTKPYPDGIVVFWKNWEWVCNSAFDAKIYIRGLDVDTLTVKFHVKHDVNPIFTPIYIEGQTFVPELFKGTEFNNALLFMDGMVVLRYH